jgi:hypothetical protein
MVIYGFGGFSMPKAGSRLKKSVARITLRFRLANAANVPILASAAAVIAKANHRRVTLRGPGIAPVITDCAWAIARRSSVDEGLITARHPPGRCLRWWWSCYARLTLSRPVERSQGHW